MSDAPTTTHDLWFPAGIAMAGFTVALMAIALLASGTTGMVAILLLGLLVPLAGITGACVIRHRLRSTIADLESTVVLERKARVAHDRVYARFIDELRAPLTGVYGLSHHLDDAGITNVVEAEELIGIVSHDATAVVRAVENIATAAQFDAGSYRPLPTAVQLDQRVPEVVQAMGRSPLEITCDVRPATVWCDLDAVRQILVNVLHIAETDGATTARIDVEERNGLGILSITDDRRQDPEPTTAPAALLGSAETLPRYIVPALVESQGGTMNTTHTLGWTNTLIRFPIATPAQLAGSKKPSATPTSSSRTG